MSYNSLSTTAKVTVAVVSVILAASSASAQWTPLERGSDNIEVVLSLIHI